MLVSWRLSTECSEAVDENLQLFAVAQTEAFADRPHERFHALHESAEKTPGSPPDQVRGSGETSATPSAATDR